MKKSNGIGIKIILFWVILTIIGGSTNAIAKSFLPDKISIITEDQVLNKVYYQDKEIKVKKINSVLGLGYCLEIYKDYPSGQLFSQNGVIPEVERLTLSNGYPNRSAAELGVASDDDAYFATQVALWSLVEGFNVYDFRADDPRIITAIQRIYEDVKHGVDRGLKVEVIQFYTNDSVQRIAVWASNEVQVNPIIINGGK